MNQNKDYPDWFLWLYEKGPFLFIFGGAILLAGIVGFAWYLDYRLDQVEGRMNYVPPSSYQPPNLDDYALGNLDVTELPVRQLVYVPVYSHVYYEGGAPYSLETTLSIRNIDPDQTIYIATVQYFDTDGKLVKTHLDQTIRLGPLQTIEFLVERRDSTGGSGANFLVEWLGERASARPLVETVMAGTVGAHGISFGRTGIEIPEKNASNGIESKDR
jgi:hypothetical protein